MSSKGSQLASTSKTICSKEENLLDFVLSDEEQTMEQQGDSAGQQQLSGQREVQSDVQEAGQQASQRQQLNEAVAGAAAAEGGGAVAAPPAAMDSIRRKVVRLARKVKGMAIRAGAASWHASKEEVFEVAGGIVVASNSTGRLADVCALNREIGLALRRSVAAGLRPLFAVEDQGGLTMRLNRNTILQGGLAEVGVNELASSPGIKPPGGCHVLDLSEPFT